jgi:transcriptional antiterminator RfaH
MDIVDRCKSIEFGKSEFGEPRVEQAHWYVIHTQPKQEQRADSNLTAWGVETFFPRLKERRSQRYTGGTTYVVKPLFSRYIFARFNPSRLHKIMFTRGVRDVVSFGGKPIPVDDEIILTIQSHIGDDGFVKLGEELKLGDQVVINDGPLRGVGGIFQKEIKDSDRVVILLAAVNYQGSIVIDKEYVRKSNHSVSGF